MIFLCNKKGIYSVQGNYVSNQGWVAPRAPLHPPPVEPTWGSEYAWYIYMAKVKCEKDDTDILRWEVELPVICMGDHTPQKTSGQPIAHLPTLVLVPQRGRQPHHLPGRQPLPSGSQQPLRLTRKQQVALQEEHRAHRLQPSGPASHCSPHTRHWT